MSNEQEFVIESGVLLKYNPIPGVTKAIIPDGVHAIDREAFKNCQMLEEIMIPTSVQHIGIAAFSGCTGLQELVIPDSVIRIGHAAVHFCSSLKKLYISAGVHIVDNSAFWPTIEEADMWKRPKRIWPLFYGCIRLKEVVAPGITQLDATAVHGEQWGNMTLEAPAYIMPALDPGKAKGGERIKRSLALGYLKAMELYPDHELYRKWLFAQRRLFLPWFFAEDNAAALAVLADSKRINVKNFEETFLLPAQGANATQCVSFLLEWRSKNISAEETERYMERQLKKQLAPIDLNKLWATEPLDDGTLCITGYKGTDTQIFIPEEINGKRVTVIGDKVFACGPMSGKTAKVKANLGKISSIVIPDSVTSIGARVFEDCQALTEVTIPESVVNFGYGVFSGCTGLTSVALPTGVTVLPDALFGGCANLKHINIPDSVVSIGDGAFSGCASLPGVSIPESVTSIGDHVFSDCSGLTYIVLPGKITNIGRYVFNNCSNLTSVAIPTGITSIGWGAFNGCASLTSIVLPEGVTSIDYHAFCDCKALTSITIPDSVTSIADDVFGGHIRFAAAIGATIKLTIHAPAGSCAEQYAKENKIPFVAE